MKEKTIEQKFRAAVKAAGGLGSKVHIARF